MKVIVAGMSKTGTKTMYAALSRLGYEVYDFLESFYFLGDDWMKTMQEGAKIEDFRRMFKDVDAVTDAPALFYWEELLEAFPDAKIILMIRDEETWYNSLMKQIGSFSKDFRHVALQTFSCSGWRLFKFQAEVIKRYGCRSRWPWSTIRFYDEEALKRLHRKHNREILQNAPKDQLLVYEVKQGWKPLCDFLGVGVPDREFPHKNKGASLIDDWRKEDIIMRRLLKEFYWTLAVLLVVMGMVLFKLFTSGWFANFLDYSVKFEV